MSRQRYSLQSITDISECMARLDSVSSIGTVNSAFSLISSLRKTTIGYSDHKRVGTVMHIILNIHIVPSARNR